MQYHYFWRTFTTKNYTTNATEESLAEEVRRIVYRYDCDCVPLFENQLGRYRAYENFWSVKSSPSSPDSQPASVSVSVPITPAVDPRPTFTPTPSPALLEDFRRKKKISDNFSSMIQFDVNFLIWLKLSDTTTANKFARLQDTQLLGNSSSVRSTKKTKRQKDTLTDIFELKQLI